MKRTIICSACGLDISQDKFDACFGWKTADQAFVVGAQQHFKNTCAGINQFLTWLEKQRNKLAEQVAKAQQVEVNQVLQELSFQLVMETTGVYHEAVLLAAYDQGLPACLVLAKKVKQYLKSIGMYSKTDKLDARGISQMGCERLLRRFKPASPKLLAIRSALRQRQALIKHQTRLKNQLHAMTSSSHTSAEVVKSIKRLLKVVAKEVEGMTQHVTELYQADAVLQRRLKPIIDKVKGLGLMTALTVVAETNGFAQISSRKQLASYAGYDIIENSSGKSQKPTRISKRGNVRIRSQMYMAAMSLIRTKQGPIYELYDRVRKRNPKHYKIANVAVQRKLLLLIYTLYTTGRAYDANYHQKQNKSSSELRPELHEIELVTKALPLEV